MNEILLKDLKRVSRKLQDAKDLDYITVMEAGCEIEDLQAKFDTISKQYVNLVKECRELTQKLIDTGNKKLINPDWEDPNWQVGYITGVTEMISVVKENENELH